MDLAPRAVEQFAHQRGVVFLRRVYVSVASAYLIILYRNENTSQCLLVLNESRALFNWCKNTCRIGLFQSFPPTHSNAEIATKHKE